MSDKKKLFYVRIDIVDLMDFATEPEGENMSLLQFAKELKKGESQYPQIQRILNEGHRYLAQKREAGRKSAELRAQKAKEEEEKINLDNSAQLNDVSTSFEHRSTPLQQNPTPFEPITVTEALKTPDQAKKKPIATYVPSYTKSRDTDNVVGGEIPLPEEPPFDYDEEYPFGRSEH